VSPRIAACLALLAAGHSLAALSPARAQEGEREASLKAAFVYNFAKFTEWPKNRADAETGPVIVCIAANSRLRPAVDELQGKLVGARPLRAMVISDGANPAACHVIYIDEASPPRLRQQAESNLYGVLTVSDLPNFARAGGTIGFYFASNQLRFQINLDAARRSGIGFSSKLLRLADVIGQQSSLPSRVATALRGIARWM
jgi:hypothetical protein